MSNPDEKWQWVDEDPIEKLLRPPVLPVKSPAAEFRAIGHKQFRQGRFEDAAGSYSAALAAEPDRAAIYYDLAVCLEKAEEWQAAANSFRRVLEDNPGHAEALAGLGSCLLHLDAAAEALSCFQRVPEAGAGSEAALLGAAVALQKLARHDEAEKIYRELLLTSPDSTELLANLIALSVARQDAAAVLEYSSRLLQVQPRSKAALQGLATLAMRDGDRAAAVEYCTRLVEVDPDSFEGWSNLRYAQQRMRPAGEGNRSIA